MGTLNGILLWCRTLSWKLEEKVLKIVNTVEVTV